MGVFGSSDSDQNKKLEADIEFIKTRLDLIARQLSGHGVPEGATSADPKLDAKLRSIYDSVRAIKIPPPQVVHEQRPAPSLEGTHIEGLDELRADIKQILNKSDRSMHLDLAQRLDSLENKLIAQSETITALKDALRDLIDHLRNR